MQPEYDWSIANISFVIELKTMKVKILALVIVTAYLPHGKAEGLGEFYARLNVNAQSSEEGEGRFSEIRSNNSWIGIRGDVAIDGDLSVIYRLEWKVDITQEKGQDNLTERPQYIGLRSERFGEVTLGRNFTPTWAVGRAGDLYNHYEGDVNALWKGDNRLSDVVTYTSPSINNFWIEAVYQAEKTADGDSAFSSGVFYGDRKLKKTSFYAGLAHDADVKDYNVTRAITRFKVAGAKITGIYHTEEPEVGGDSRNGYLVNLSYIFGKLDYRLQYQTLEDDMTYSVGVDYRLTDRFKLYTWFTKIDKEDVEDNNFLAVGFQYDFVVQY